MNFKKVCLVPVLAAAWATSAHAGSLDFSFVLPDLAPPPAGPGGNYVGYSTTGEIVGLSEGVSTPSEIIVTGVPEYPPPSPLGIELSTPAVFEYSQFLNPSSNPGLVGSFTVTDVDGVPTITAADLYGYDASSNFIGFNTTDPFNSAFGGFNMLYIGDQGVGSPSTGNALGFGGVTYTFDGTVPEPPSLHMCLLGLALVAAWGMRQRKLSPSR